MKTAINKIIKERRWTLIWISMMLAGLIFTIYGNVDFIKEYGLRAWDSDIHPSIEQVYNCWRGSNLMLCGLIVMLVDGMRKD